MTQVSVGELRGRREEILRIAARHGAYDVSVFGSVVRGEARPESDVDFLVRFEKGRSLFDFIALMHDLETALDQPVDVVEEGALHWYIRDGVLAEAQPL